MRYTECRKSKIKYKLLHLGTMNRSRSHYQLATVIGILMTCSTRAFSYKLPPTDDEQLAGPVIIPRISEIILQNGQNFTLMCVFNKPIRLKQQEIPEEMIGSDFKMVERNVTSPDSNYKYAQQLELYNVDHFAVGYYACFEDTVDKNTVLNNITRELTNTENISYFYIYVNGSDRIFAPMREVVLARSGSKVIIGCRPTTPDIKVTITLEPADVHEYEQYDPKIGFIFDSDELPDVELIIFVCMFWRRNEMEQKEGFVNKYSNRGPPKPNIEGERYFINGETFSLNCTVVYQNNIPTVLKWKIPRNNLQGVYNRTNEREVGEILYNYITIENARETDAGNYICISENGPDQQYATFQKVFAETGFVNLTKGQKENIIETKQNVFKLHTTIIDYPPANIVYYKDGIQLPNNTGKYILSRKDDSVDLTIRAFTVEDTGIYTLVASNHHATSNVTYDLRRLDKPRINFGQETSKAFLIHTTATLQCEAVGYPLPTISWKFKNENGQEEEIPSKDQKILSRIKVISEVEIPVRISGNITCNAFNRLGSSSASKEFFVYEIANGFGIRNSDKTWFPEGQKMQLTCLASKYEYSNLTWYGNDDEGLIDFVSYYDTPFSHIALLNIENISLDQAGNYTCLGNKWEDSEPESVTVVVTIEGIRRPIINESHKDENWQLTPYQRVQLNCVANAVPPPIIRWYKDGLPLTNSTAKVSTESVDNTIVNSTVVIEQMTEEHKGKYECVAISGEASTKRAYNLQIKEKSTNLPVYLYACGVIAFVLVIVVVYLMCKIRKEKQFRKELAAAGLLYFKEGVPKSLSPDLGIDEQAEMLPYDERFEFPPEKLILGAQLGAGAFGVVYKAEARGIINAEESTPVAVKMVKKNADNMYIKALASELKIMIHLGKHINILNLLGACTKNVGKRELIVIVEYCKFGNIHKYMLRHREVFIDQLTDNKEKNLGKVNKAFSCSSGSSGMHSDYFSNHTQETDHTFVSSANTSRSVRKDNAPQKVEMVKVSENGYVAPEWRSNYESDYSFDARNPRPLTSRDLLAWAFQIARGMEYLASRKVLHGDLAARNILLAEDNVIKICDFGLARSIYKNDEYQKKENSPLPVKWLAIECMTDRIFSTQSDVWSFGIVLWELFSLAKTPYPNISPQNLLQWLNEGHRLEKPPYADDKLYNLMKRCWEQKPTARPSFSRLQEILGSFLEENVRNHYVDLNSAYMDMKPEGEDYLAMVCAPDYNNMVTPSPHEYVNEPRRFFSSTPTPTQLEHDDEGYLMMNRSNVKFSPRSSNAASEATVHGSELTPMLTLNNLPTRSGSESDYDGSSSPYLKMCPRIVEEADEVFETKQNNIKNTQNTAISNPTYTTFDVDPEKNPNNISSNYINVNVPNGLVN